nr:SRPBCC family protein [Sphingomonas sp. Y57]
MTTTPVTYADVRAIIDHPIGRVWPLVADFGGLAAWAAGVTGCVMDGEGPGAVRTVALGDRVARERLEAIDPVQHRLRYHILPPHSMPADEVCSDISLTMIENNRTELRWSSEASGFFVPPEQIGARIEGFYSKSIEGLRRLLDRG